MILVLLTAGIADFSEEKLDYVLRSFFWLKYRKMEVLENQGESWSLKVDPQICKYWQAADIQVPWVLLQPLSVCVL